MKNKKLNLATIIQYIFLIAMAMMFIMPLLFTLVSSLKDNRRDIWISFCILTRNIQI